MENVSTAQDLKNIGVGPKLRNCQHPMEKSDTVATADDNSEVNLASRPTASAKPLVGDELISGFVAKLGKVSVQNATEARMTNQTPMPNQ